MTYLTSDSNANKALIDLRVFYKYIKLLSYLFTLDTILLEFINYTRYKIDEYYRDSY